MPSLVEELKKRVLIVDGAMGSLLQTFNLTKEDFKGKEGCNDYLCLTKPEVIKEIHRKYLEAGADIITTNTFGGSRLKLNEYGIGDKTYELNHAAAKLAKEVTAEFTDNPCFVLGDLGPSGFLPSSTDPELSNITTEKLEEIYHEQAKGLIDGGADALLIETGQDILEVKAAIIGVRKCLNEKKSKIPLIAHVTLELGDRMLLGTNIQSVLTTLEAMPCDIIGLNCSQGPHQVKDAVRYLSKHSTKMLSLWPNAGIPENINGKAVYPINADDYAKLIYEMAVEYNLNLIGGCCGSDPSFISKIQSLCKNLKPKQRKPEKIWAASSGMTSVDLIQDPSPAIVGERTNALGSRKFKRLLQEEKFDEALEVAKHQVDAGSHILDLSVAHNDLEKKESFYMNNCIKKFCSSVTAPLMIDTTSAEVAEAALKIYPGRAIINSINLEGEGERIKEMCPIIKKYGAAAVAMCIGKEGMAETAEKKLEVAKQILEQAKTYGLAAEELIYDTLTFPLTTGEDKYKNSAVETIEGIKLIKKHLPGCKTTLGVSNVSFGIKENARQVVNSIFLYHAVKAGLDMAIVNPKQITPYNEIDKKEKTLAEDVIFNKHKDALGKFIQYFEGIDPKKEENTKLEELKAMPLDKRIHVQILNRIPETLIENLDEALKKNKPLEIINNILLPAMKEVGDKMATGEMILPFVLEAAGLMKKSVAHLEQFMDKDDSYTKGKIVVATVYGDVHDIGKNLLKTILTNNGYTVIDLGKQVPANTIIETAVKEKVDAIGLSALLVSTSQQMKVVTTELDKRGLTIPLMVGGAAINSRFTKEVSLVHGKPYAGLVHYCNDSFAGLKTLNKIVDKEEKKELDKKAIEEVKKIQSQPTTHKDITKNYQLIKKPTIAQVKLTPKPPFYGIKVIKDINLHEVYPYLNLDYVFKLGWGIKAKDQKAYQKLLDDKFLPILHGLKQECIDKKWLQPKVLYGYFPANSEDNDIIIYDPQDHDKEIERITFPRQDKKPYWCLADFLLPKDKGKDVLAVHIVTVGDKASEVANKLNNDGDYNKSLYLHGLSTETAEALAEWTHLKVREELGLKKDQGRRFSFGYPACPRIEDQEQLFNITDATKKINVKLTSAFLMDPEQSTSALIFHHPDADYFNV